MQSSSTAESYLKELWQSRWRIVAVTVAVAAVTAIISLLLPKTFEATAQLMVITPKEKLEAASQTPAVQTCQMLLRSPKYLKEVLRWLTEGRGVIDYVTKGKKLDPAYIQGIRMTAPVTIAARTSFSLEVAKYVTQLDDDGLMGLADFDLDELKKMTVEDLGESLFADVTEEKKTAIDIIYSPIVQLRARGKTAQQAAALANVWAAVFLHMYGELIRGTAERSLTFWQSSAERLEKRREEKLDETRSFRLRYNLEFLQGWLDNATEDYRDLEDELARRRRELDDETSKMVSLRRSLEAVEDDGVWIGASTVSASLEKPGVTGTYLEMRGNVLSAARRLRRATAELDAFVAQNNLDTLRKEAERATLDLVNYESRLKEETVRADQTSRTLARIRKQLDQTTATMILRRPNANKGVSEIVNPAWDELQLERIRLEVAYGEALAARNKLATLVQEMAKTVHQQAIRLHRLETEYERLRTNLDLAREEYNGYQQAYARLKREIYDTAQGLEPMRSRVRHLEDATAAMKTQIDDTMTSITNGQTGLALREADDETWQEYVKLAQQNLRDAELAVDQQGINVYVSAEAIPPTKKIWPQRTLMVLALAFLGFFFSVGYICTRHYLVTAGLLSR